MLNQERGYRHDHCGIDAGIQNKMHRGMSVRRGQLNKLIEGEWEIFLAQSNNGVGDGLV